MGRPAVFLDRDGTIVDDPGHLADPAALRLLGGAAAGIRRLNAIDLPVVVVTNQSVVGRGLVDEAGLARIHGALCELLHAEGAAVDAVYHCPHHPTEAVGEYRRACRCRKPGTELLERAARDLDLDLGRSYMVGDSVSDFEAGATAGCRTVLVRTGRGFESERELFARGLRTDFVALGLLQAATWIARTSLPARPREARAHVA